MKRILLGVSLSVLGYGMLIACVPLPGGCDQPPRQPTLPWIPQDEDHPKHKPVVLQKSSMNMSKQQTSKPKMPNPNTPNPLDGGDGSDGYGYGDGGNGGDGMDSRTRPGNGGNGGNSEYGKGGDGGNGGNAV